jgi:hypothetical protein
MAVHINGTFRGPVPISFPNQEGNEGKVLMTDGASLYWANSTSSDSGEELPPITNMGGRVLKTDGETIFWSINTGGSAPINLGMGSSDDVLEAYYHYDENGRIDYTIETIFGDEKRSEFTYNELGLIETLYVTFQGKTRTETYTYTENGKVESMTAVNTGGE